MYLDKLGSDSQKSDTQKIVQETLGYLNYSSGMTEPRFLGNVNELFALIGTHQVGAEPVWREMGRLLRDSLERLRGRSEAFRRVEQAEAVLRLVFDNVLPAYRRHHRDLLFHQSDEALFRPFFVGRVCEAVLAEGAPWNQTDRIIEGSLGRLNDFVGHRPVAVLETDEKIEPYVHERVRPIPLYVRVAGVAGGRYHDLIQRALDILRATDPDLLGEAWFDPELLDELALDPRAYDFDHPANRRPNYHFGQWDPHHIDNRGYYRRFVLQQVTLDAMLGRILRGRELPREELLFEAAAVLAGTMLMGSGVSGNGPDAHDSDTTLATLLPKIALYRDEFYEQLLTRLPGTHGKRLRAESVRLRQPLGGARQDLNQELARRRAEQLQHVHLARLFARMGYREAAIRQAQTVPVASARMTCEIQCRLSTAHLQIDRGELQGAAELLTQIDDLLDRAIECGALIDPWNILGFGVQFPLFPALENSIHDVRADELIELMGEIFALYARLEKEAAAAGQTDLKEKLSSNLGELAQWWDKFATVEVSAVMGISGHEAWESAAHVATALGAWHKAGTAAGDIAFWREHVGRFHSPKAYALVVEALLGRGDLVASMALLIQWVSQAERIALAEGEYAFHDLAIRWMKQVWNHHPSTDQPADDQAVEPERQWSLARQFLDRLEANAEQLWEVPRLELLGQPVDSVSQTDAVEDEEDESESLFSAAYEDVTYRDSADDGFEGEMLEGSGGPTDFELSAEVERIMGRLAFLIASARLWKLAAAASWASGRSNSDRDETLAGWLAHAVDNRRKLLDLLAALHRYRIDKPGVGSDSLIEYDRRQAIREELLEQIIDACLETADAARLIAATMGRDEPVAAWDEWEEPARRVLRAIFTGQPEAVRAGWKKLTSSLSRQPLLYVPTSRGGNPRRIVASRSLQQVLCRLLAYLPRLGLIDETYQLIGTVQGMERDHPVGPGAITEFDAMFEIGCQAIVRCLVTSTEELPAVPRDPNEAPSGPFRQIKPGPFFSPGPNADALLIDCLKDASEPLLLCWLAHSRNIRLSVLDPLADEDRWRELVKFIRRYGDGLFTQKFMNFANLRAILHQGVDDYLRWLADSPETEEQLRLLADLDGPLDRDEAILHLTTIIEAACENYVEYMDYNSTTTQSDRGDMLYTLLDFLRLLAGYDRMAWNLQPMVLVHGVLVRRGRAKAAEMWREALAGRTADIAEGQLQRFEQLSREYGMRLPSVAERLGERFVRPLLVDRLRALVGPAIDELRGGRQTASFELLDAEIDKLTEQPTGVGFDVPTWLDALEQEVDAIRTGTSEDNERLDPYPHVPQVHVPLDQLQRQVERWQSDE